MQGCIAHRGRTIQSGAQDETQERMPSRSGAFTAPPDDGQSANLARKQEFVQKVQRIPRPEEWCRVLHGKNDECDVVSRTEKSSPEYAQ